MYLLLRWILNTLVLMLVSYLTPGISIASFWTALIASAIFGLINAVIRPIILILTLPINILTLGLLTFVINALMFWLLSAIVKGFDVQSFASAFWGALVYCIIVTIIGLIDQPDRRQA